MKKYLFCILAMVLVLCSCATNKPAESVGKPETDVSSTQTQQKDDNLSSNTVTTKPETDVSSTQAQEVLSAEDKAVKAEIAKYSDTKVDFRHNRQENIFGKTYDISFSKFNMNENPDRVVYKNDLGDEFEYDIKTGKLCNARLESNKVEKTSDSIDIETAHKIALQYFPEDCDINQYTNDIYVEIDEGYAIGYTRYIGKYITTDAFFVAIGFNGSAIDINDVTDEFDGKNINFDQSFVDAKIAEYMADKENLELQTVVIMVYNGKVSADCSFKQTLSGDIVSAYHVRIPLE